MQLWVHVTEIGIPPVENSGTVSGTFTAMFSTGLPSQDTLTQIALTQHCFSMFTDL